MVAYGPYPTLVAAEVSILYAVYSLRLSSVAYCASVVNDVVFASDML